MKFIFRRLSLRPYLINPNRSATLDGRQGGGRRARHTYRTDAGGSKIERTQQRSPENTPKNATIHPKNTPINQRIPKPPYATHLCLVFAFVPASRVGKAHKANKHIRQQKNAQAFRTGNPAFYYFLSRRRARGRPSQHPLAGASAKGETFCQSFPGAGSEKKVRKKRKNKKHYNTRYRVRTRTTERAKNPRK